MKRPEIQSNLLLVQATLEHWLTLRKFLNRAFSEEPISADDEPAFLDVKTGITRNMRAMTERIKDVGGKDYGQKIIRDLMTKCVSVQHMRALPLNDRRILLKEWHTVFIRLSRAVGAFKFASEGYVPPGSKGAKAAHAKKKKLIIAAVVAAVVLVGGGVAVVVLGLI